MRGEHEGFRLGACAGRGSSPHARGTPRVRCKRPAHRGIIPACAGNTHPSHHQRLYHLDHPRMRGEHLPAAILTAVTLGSSPHARGTHMVVVVVPCRARIIPACAWNTVELILMPVLAEDHPRMRGEHYLCAPLRFYDVGSSPHARGTHYGGFAYVDRHGIIPACAGNTGWR